MICMYFSSVPGHKKSIDFLSYYLEYSLTCNGDLINGFSMITSTHWFHKFSFHMKTTKILCSSERDRRQWGRRGEEERGWEKDENQHASFYSAFPTLSWSSISESSNIYAWSTLHHNQAILVFSRQNIVSQRYSTFSSYNK